MTQNYHTPIINADPRKNDSAIWNDPLGDLDSQLGTATYIATVAASEVANARGSYATLDSRIDAIAISGGAGAAGTVASNTSTTTVPLGTGEAARFTVGAPIVYSVGGLSEYGHVASIAGSALVLQSAPSGQINSGTVLSQISQSEYEAALVMMAGGTESATLPSTVEWLQREINVKAFGAYGDGSSHLVSSGAALTTARAAFPLTQAAFGITAVDEYDWCAIQEAVLTAGQISGVNIENVYIPVGSYKVNRTIVVPLVSAAGRTMTITGGGYRGVIAGANITATANISIFLIPGLTTIRQLHLFGNDATNASSIGIRIGGLETAGDPWSHNNCLHVTIDRVYFNAGFYRCISALYEVDQLKVTHCTSGGALGQAVVYLSNDAATNGISASAGVVIESCAFANNGSTTGGDSLYGIYLMGTEDSVIRNCVIRGYDNTIYLTGVPGVRNDGVVIEGIHSEINQPLKLSLANRWTPATAYTAGAYVRPAQAGANGWWYKCTTSGTSAATSIRTATYRWTASARGTGEYYLELAAGGNPAVNHPHGIMAGGAPQAYNFAGDLQVSQWGYGNNDGLAFNTIYVRLSDSSDPDGKATHYLWTTDNEPVWPTTYGATVTDGTAVWTAYKRAVFCNIAAPVGSVNGGLRINSCWFENFNSFIHAEQSANSDVTRVYVNGCTVRTTDMIYNSRAAVRHAVMFENSQLDGCIKPFSNVISSTNNQSSVLVRFCSRSFDYTGALGDATTGVASWYTNEPAFGSGSDSNPDNVDFQLDPRSDSQITVSTGSSSTATKVYVPYLPSNAFINGLRGKTITITHGDGGDGLTVEFNSQQSLLHGAVATTSLSLPRVGDSVTIRFAVTAAGTIRWTVVGSHGLTTAEGTWTPTITGSGSAPSISYTTQDGFYSRIGNIVFFTFNVVIGGTFSGGTGNIRIGGFPITASALTQPQCVVLVSGVDVPGTPISMIFAVIASTATGNFFTIQDNVAVAAWPLTALATGDTLVASGFYFV